MIRKLKKTKDKVDKEKLTLLKILVVLKSEYNIDARHVSVAELNSTFIWASTEGVDIVFTICNAYQNKRCIKIEDFIIDHSKRNKGLGTKILNDINKVCKENNTKIGLWVKLDNERGKAFYERNGYVLKETLNDYWLEYN